MYLPDEIIKARVLITVKTYPLPTSAFGERVCTAGLLEDGKWVRIYPIAWQVLKDDQKYPKYSWVELDLKRYTSDFRPETYKPKLGFDENIIVLDTLGTDNAWAARKHYVFKEVFTSMQELIGIAKSEAGKSLATLKPVEIIDLIIEEEQEKEWKESWLNLRKQTNLFDLDAEGQLKEQPLIKKLPYRFKYRFISEGDKNPRLLSIQDWEIGALFWNCFRRAHGDNEEAKRLVRKKYFDEFLSKKDLFLFLGTDYKYHKKNSPDPFIIIGVFYPPKTDQPLLF
jgi:hypothetical protein